MNGPPAPLGWAGPLPVLRWPEISSAGVEAVVTTRRGGVSSGPFRSLNLGLHVGDDAAAVAENRRRAAAAVGASSTDLVVGQQVHGNRVAVVTAADLGRGALDLSDALPEVDALITAVPGPVLVTLVADCVPILLVDPIARVLATVHAGWRGTAAGVTGTALEVMGELGADPSRMVAAIGPAVSPDTYRVGDDVAEALAAAVGDEVLAPSGDGGWLVDLVEGNRRSLVARGVAAERIVTAGMATGNQGPFFSDREARPCGRFGLLARLRP
jgi:YfiH family protein